MLSGNGSVNIVERGVWQGKTALVTGASSGIGRALAVELARHGARVALAARRLELLQATERSISRLGGEAAVFAVDVSDPLAVQRVVQAVAERWGHIDVIVANAGRGGQVIPEQLDVDDIADLFHVNTLGAVYCVAAALPQMLKRGAGHIVVVSSLVAWLPQPFSIGYGATKAAAAYFFESLRIAVRNRGIKVSVVYPGFVHTEMTAHGRYPMPFAISAEDAARRIRRGLERGKAQIVFPWRAAAAIKLAGLLPRGIRDRLWWRLLPLWQRQLVN